MKIEKEFEILAIHGEGDRKTVNKLKQHINEIDAQHHARYNIDLPNHLKQPVDEKPDVIIILRDNTHTFRIEWRPETWEEVEQWKKLAGYDENKRHWKHGSKIKVKIG
jgi:hypothetical protein